MKEEAWRTHPVTRVLGAHPRGPIGVGACRFVHPACASYIAAGHKIAEYRDLCQLRARAVDSVFITGSVPAREKRVIVDGLQTVLVTGEGIIPQSKARVWWSFVISHNRRDDPCWVLWSQTAEYNSIYHDRRRCGGCGCRKKT